MTIALGAAVLWEKKMRLIDADSLLRLVEIRKKWHKDLDVDEVEDMIKDAPTVCAIDCRKLDNQHNM